MQDLPLAFLKQPFRIAAILLMLLGLGSCARGAAIGTSMLLFFLAAAALFGAWAVTAPPKRQCQGLLDDALDEVHGRLTETPAERQQRLWGRWFK